MQEATEQAEVDDFGAASQREMVLPGALGRVFTRTHRIVEAAVIALFLAIVVVAILQVVNRFAVGRSLSWSEEFQRYGHIWLVFLAVPIGYRRGAHIGVDFLQKVLTGRNSILLEWVLDIAWLTLGLILVTSTWILMGVAWRQHSPGIGLTMDKIYFGLVLGGCYLAFTAVDRLLQKILGAAAK